MSEFSVTIKEASKELSKKEMVKLKDLTECGRLDELSQSLEELTFKPVAYVILSIHNEKAQDKDYENYVIIDDEGNRYVTGSTSFWRAFVDIFSDMQDCDEDWSIKVGRRKSKNYVGKEFLTCTVV